MKKIFFTAVFFKLFLLTAFEIPFSETVLKSERNHLSNFVKIYPADSLIIPMKTDVWLWRDKENLKLYFEAEINDNFNKGKLAKRDEWVECDFMRVQIITDITDCYAYMFSIFPLGNKDDGIRQPDLNINSEWDSNYTYENNISDTIWSSSVTIPFKDLRFYGSPPYKWKIILTRYFQNEDEYYSIPFGTVDMGKDYFRTAYDITIKDDISNKKNYRITPYFTKKYDLRKKSFGSENIGLDFSFNPASSAKMKISINPDFTDIPIDEVEDNFNVRYSPSYSENRYFFIEDLDVFGTENRLFYSRHIRQPQYAVKFTGNSKKFSYGFLSAMDKKITEGDELLNNDDFFNILAFKSKRQNLSVQITLLNRMNKNYHNEVFVLNPVWEFIPNNSIWFESDLSLIKKSNTKKGYFLSTGYNGKKGNIDWSASIYKCSKNYSADTGLLYRTDFSRFKGNINYKKEINNEILKSFGSNIRFNRNNESDNSLYRQDAGFGFWTSFKQKFNINADINSGQENFEGIIRNFNSIYISFSYWKYSLMNFQITYGINKTLVYSLNDIYRARDLNIRFWGDIGTKLSYNIFVQQNKYFDFPTESNADDQYRIINTDLTINFSNYFSLTNGLRYNDYESLYSSSYLGFFSNLRFEFKENCNIYLGYKTAQDEIEKEFITDYEQIFTKISYNF